MNLLCFRGNWLRRLLRLCWGRCLRSTGNIKIFEFTDILLLFSKNSNWLSNRNRLRNIGNYSCKKSFFSGLIINSSLISFYRKDRISNIKLFANLNFPLKNFALSHCWTNSRKSLTNKISTLTCHVLDSLMNLR